MQSILMVICGPMWMQFEISPKLAFSDSGRF